MTSNDTAKHMKTIAVVGMITTALVAIASLVIVCKKRKNTDEDMDDFFDEIADELADALNDEEVETLEEENEQSIKEEEPAAGVANA